MWLVSMGVDKSPVFPICGLTVVVASMFAAREAAGRRQYRRRRRAGQVPVAAGGLDDGLPGDALRAMPRSAPQLSLIEDWFRSFC
jgi:hypothetical protein